MGAGKVLVAVSQQLQDNGHALGQGDLIGGAESAVRVSGDKPSGYAGLYKASRPMGIGYVRVGGGGSLSHLVSVGGGLDRHGDKLGPGDGAVQLHVALAVAHHNTQGVDYLGHLLLGRDRGGAGAGRQYQHPHKQGSGSAGGENGF